MKKALKRVGTELYYYDKNGIKIPGLHSDLYGDISDLHGNIDLCEITEEERKAGIKVEDLVEDETKI